MIKSITNSKSIQTQTIVQSDKHSSEDVGLIFNFNENVKTQKSEEKLDTSKNDKRPSVSNEEKEWIKGHYVNIKQNSLKVDVNTTTFIAYEETEDGHEEIKITLRQTEDNRTIMSRDRFGKGIEVLYFEIDNKSGKILSKQSKTGNFTSKRVVYNKNGKVTTDNISLENELLRNANDCSQIDFKKANEYKSGPANIVW